MTIIDFLTLWLLSLTGPTVDKPGVDIQIPDAPAQVSTHRSKDKSEEPAPEYTVLELVWVKQISNGL